MLKNSESTLRPGYVSACSSGEELAPIITQLETNLKASLNLKYPTYPAPFSTVLLGNSPQSSNAKPKKQSLAPTRGEVGEFRFNQLRQYRRTFTENEERLNLNAPKTPTHMHIGATNRKSRAVNASREHRETSSHSPKDSTPPPLSSPSVCQYSARSGRIL